MDLILFIVVVVVLIYQNSKINKLQGLIGGKAQAPTPSASKPPAQAAVSVTAAPPSLMPNAQVPAPMAAPAPLPPVSAVPSEEMSGRILGRIGIGAVVIGVAFFLKYAFDNDWVGPSGRVMIGIMIGIALIALGQWLRKKYLGYADLLAGGGLAVLYLSVYASFALYGIVTPTVAFLGLAIVTMLGVGLSLMDSTQTLAVVATIGGYLAPALIGVSLIGTGITFGYLTILNVGILGILVYKKWAPLVLIGLVGTWLHFGSWLVASYTSDLLIPTLIFLLAQFLIFTAASVIRLIVEKRKAEEIDYVLLALTALSFACSCYYLLMPQYRDFLSLGFALVAVFYGAVALLAFKENPEDRTLNIFLPGLSVAFLTAAIPIEFSGSWISAWWFIESLVLYIVASKSSSRGYQVMGVVVYILGLLKLFQYIFLYQAPPDYALFLNGPFLMLCLAVFSGYAIAFVYFRYGSIAAEIQKRGISAFVIIANILTIYALTSQITMFYGLQMTAHGFAGDYSGLENTSNTAVSILWTLYAALLTAIGFVKKYPTVRRMGLVLFIVTACKVVLDVWSLGEIYRIVSFIVFGVIALTASFMYAKYKDRLKEIV